MRIAVIGDIHGLWSDEDVRAIDARGYAGVLVVGDVAGFRFSTTQALVRRLARLETPLFLMPGNHDGVTGLAMAGHALGQRQLSEVGAEKLRGRMEALRTVLGRHVLAGFSAHRLGAVSVIAGRPHSMGGPVLSFPRAMQGAWGVATMQESAAAIRRAVDAAPTRDVIFLAHNGPEGLGARATDIWGCDFRRGGGDWGDPDLTAGIAYARSRGLRVLAVVAGHMHRHVKGGGERVAMVRDEEDTLYVNAAEVPRARDGARHHVELVIEGGRATARDLFV